MTRKSKNQRAFARGDYFFTARPVPLIEDPLKNRRIELLNRFFSQHSGASIQAALDYVAMILQAESGGQQHASV